MTNETVNIVNDLRWLASKKCNGVDVDDFMQDIFLKLLQSDKFNTLPDHEKTAYVFCCICNLAIDRSRRKTGMGRPAYHSPLYESSATVSSDVFVKLELKEIMQKAHGREVCKSLMMYAEGYTNREIAEITGTNINTILGRCRYARKFLRA